MDLALPVDQGRSIELPTTAEMESRWAELCRFTRANFSDPNMQALEIALCCYVTHFFPNDLPVWLQVIGVPSSGKTRIVMGGLSCLPGTLSIDDISKTS